MAGEASEERSLEGWDPGIPDPAGLADLVDLAFDYRGDVTVVRTDGSEIVGYLFNRDRRAREPFAELYPRDGGEAITMPYATIRTIRFTGKDTAAGNSYAAWLRSREAARAAARSAAGA